MVDLMSGLQRTDLTPHSTPQKGITKPPSLHTRNSATMTNYQLPSVRTEGQNQKTQTSLAPPKKHDTPEIPNRLLYVEMKMALLQANSSSVRRYLSSRSAPNINVRAYGSSKFQPDAALCETAKPFFDEFPCERLDGA